MTVDVAVSGSDHGDDDPDDLRSAGASEGAAAADGQTDGAHPVRQSRASGQLRNQFSASSPTVVAPAPAKRRRRTNPVTRTIGALLHGAGRVFGFALALLLLAAMAVPPLVMLVALGWSAATMGKTIWDAAHLVRGLRVDLLSDKLDTLGWAVRVALASLSFFAIIFALSVLLGGLMARGRRQWLSLPGVLLALLTMSCFFLTALSLVGEATRLGAPLWTGVAFVAYALLDAVTIAVALTDTRPPEPRHQTPHLRSRRNTHAVATTPDEPFLIPDETEEQDERFRTVMLPETRKWGTPAAETLTSEGMTAFSISAENTSGEDDSGGENSGVVPVSTPNPQDSTP